MRPKTNPVVQRRLSRIVGVSLPRLQDITQSLTWTVKQAGSHCCWSPQDIIVLHASRVNVCVVNVLRLLNLNRQRYPHQSRHLYPQRSQLVRLKYLNLYPLLGGLPRLLSRTGESRQKYDSVGLLTAECLYKVAKATSLLMNRT